MALPFTIRMPGPSTHSEAVSTHPASEVSAPQASTGSTASSMRSGSCAAPPAAAESCGPEAFAQRKTARLRTHPPEASVSRQPGPSEAPEPSSASSEHVPDAASSSSAAQPFLPSASHA